MATYSTIADKQEFLEEYFNDEVSQTLIIIGTSFIDNVTQCETIVNQNLHKYSNAYHISNDGDVGTRLLTSFDVEYGFLFTHVTNETEKAKFIYFTSKSEYTLIDHSLNEERIVRFD